MNSVRCIVLFLLVMISFSVRAFQSTSRRLASSPSTVRSRSDTRRALTTDIYIVGKKTGGEEWIASGIEEYEKRLRPVMTCKTIFLKTDDELIKALGNVRAKKGVVLALDERGKEYSSRQFSKLVFESLVRGGSQLSLFIGGAQGLPAAIQSSVPLISLSKMTWTHQHARLLLIEQLYRASEIHKGSKYHKD